MNIHTISKNFCLHWYEYAADQLKSSIVNRESKELFCYFISGFVTVIPSGMKYKGAVV